MATKKATARRTRGTPKNARARRPKGPEVKDRFIDALAEVGTVRHACEAAGIGRRTAYNWRDEDKAFAAAWDDALEEAADMLEREAIRRAVEGWDEPVWWKGELAGTVRKFSDTLLIFMLKGIRPEKYRERVDQRGQMTMKFDGEPKDVLEAAQERARLKVVPIRKTG